MPIHSGSVSGNEITFSMIFSRGDRTMEMTYTGTVEGDEMTGKFVTPRGEVPFTGKRKAGE